MLVSPADLVAVAKATITECSVTDVEQCLGAGTLLIDIREADEFRKGHITKLVESAKTDQNLANDDQPIVLYCGTGGRSALAAQCLESLGYKNVSSMSGGIVAWAAAHLPLDFPT